MAESISVSPLFSSTSKPAKTSTSSSGAYILSIASLPGQYAASSSSPSNKIDIFDKSTLQLVHTLPGHQEATAALKSITSIGGNNGKIYLISSGKDGTVVVWDERTNSPGLKMTNAGKNQPILCFDVSPDGMTVAAGTDLQGEDALIHYWDPRKPSAPLRTHGSTHSDDITTLSFLSSRDLDNNNLLLSGSSDGLISISNADEADEDEAVLHVANWGCSISQAGWIPGQQQQRANIWAASDMETFSTWTGQLESLLSVDIRNPSVHDHGRTWVTDYLITCVPDTKSSSLPGSPNLGVFVGSNEGDVALLSHSDLTTAGAAWNIHKQWSNGHVGIVRALLWDEEYNVIVSGGEDAKINVWSGPGIVDDDNAKYI
ncbi:WD40-repeat-containing domain protein [Amanita muscaria]